MKIHLVLHFQNQMISSSLYTSFQANPELLSFTKKDWEEITEDVFKKVFKNSAVKRTKLEGLRRNVEFLK
ncbi:hypothetical protein B0I10_106153 [Flavobacterium lacus]|uniref:Uncharacterized protein n=1 Tax=Flavobacterium lacus TaxID=1353778 RepID=A0A328WP94_9FLAO|nr:hypothetical protein B0I10_106153 [Flavobacterium lacus]